MRPAQRAVRRYSQPVQYALDVELMSAFGLDDCSIEVDAADWALDEVAIFIEVDFGLFLLAFFFHGEASEARSVFSEVD